MAWLSLSIAILAEVAATLALKASAGLTRPPFVVAVVAGYLAAFGLLAVALKGIGVGPAYATWSGVGTVGIAIGSWLLFGERLGALAQVGVALVIVGVALINLAPPPR